MIMSIDTRIYSTSAKEHRASLWIDCLLLLLPFPTLPYPLSLRLSPSAKILWDPVIASGESFLDCTTGASREEPSRSSANEEEIQKGFEERMNGAFYILSGALLGCTRPGIVNRTFCAKEVCNRAGSAVDRGSWNTMLCLLGFWLNARENIVASNYL